MNEPTVKKEELKKKFDEECRSIINTTNLPMVVRGCLDRAFNHLYSEIEERERSITILAKEMKNQDELIKAADLYIKKQIELDNISCQTGGNPITTGHRIQHANREMLEALSKYQTLKSKLTTTSTQGD